MRRWSVISPALAVQQLGDYFAGTSADRFVLFEQHAAALRTTWQSYFGPKIMRLEEMTRADLNQVPDVPASAADAPLGRVAWPTTGRAVALVGALVSAAAYARRLNA